jgi:uncharacterized protein YlzI (FlbEa/FlbD family)
MGMMMGEKISLEDCVFKSIMDLGSLSGRIRSNTGSEYQKNVDNYYYQVMNLWAFVSDYMDEETIKQREEIIKTAQVKYRKLTIGKSYISKDKTDEVVNLTFETANKIFELICSTLSYKGILREQSAGAIAGIADTEDIKDEELNADDEEGAIAGSDTQEPPQGEGAPVDGKV